MIRTAWGYSVVLALAGAGAGCQTTEAWNALIHPQGKDAQTYAAHSQPQTEAAAPWRKPVADQDSPEEILKYATEQDNAHRRNPADLDSLRNARLAYEKILQDNPQHAYVLHRLGTVADRERNFQKAEEYYLAALQLNPNSVDLLSDLGYSYLLQGRLRESEQVLQQVLHVNPQQPKARVNLGLVYAQLGRAEDAYALIRTEKGEAEARELVARALRPAPAGREPPRAPALPPATELTARAASEPPVQPNNKATQELWALIQKAREERQSRQPLPSSEPVIGRATPAPWEEQAPSDSSQLPPSTPYGQQSWETGDLPPEQWNSAFRQIDQSSDAPMRVAAQPVQRPIVQTAATQPVQEHWVSDTPGVYALTPPPTGTGVQHAAGVSSPIPIDARSQAARLGMQAGGGTLFAPLPGQGVVHADARQPATLSSPPRRLESSPKPGPQPEVSPEEAAELQLLSEQVLQLQEQIAQKRAELQRAEWERTRQ